MGRLPLLLLAALSIIGGTAATVTLSSSGRQYHSRPAAFGFELEYGLQYVALLQVVEEDLHLCAGTEEIADGEFDDGRVGNDDDWGYEGVIHGDGGRGGGIGLEGAKEANAMAEPQKRGLRSSSGEAPTRAALLATVGYHALGGRGEAVNIGNLGDDGDKKEAWREAERNETQKEIHVVPSNGVPVAILAKRGQCTYETKAKVASTLTSPHGTVRFLVVYDDRPEDGNHLITMMPKEPTDARGTKRRGRDIWKDVGLVFVSYESGVDLREFVDAQSAAVVAAGGPRILIDGTDRWIFPPMDESAAGLAFLLMLFGCVCSLSLFLNTTLYGSGRSSDGSVVNDHHLFLLGPDGLVDAGRRGGNAGNGRRGNSLRLLTMEEVETLPTREYCGDGGGSPSSSSAGLELRDKSEMPYLAGEDRDEGAGDAAAAAGGGILASDDDDGDARDAAQGGGGLCESLLPASCKKADDDAEYYFRHNSCSICLDEYRVGEQIRVLPCQHTFHSNCIFPWLTERSPTCPLCKAMFEAVRYEEEADEAEGREASDEEQQSVRTETSGPSPPPPLEEEPPVHRRRRQRQRRERRSGQDGSNARDSNADANSEASDEAEPSGHTNGEEEGAVDSSSDERRSSGLRGRLWGLFGGSATGTAAATTAQTSALEEPLLTSSDDDGNEDDAV